MLETAFKLPLFEKFEPPICERVCGGPELGPMIEYRVFQTSLCARRTALISKKWLRIYRCSSFLHWSSSFLLLLLVSVNILKYLTRASLHGPSRTNFAYVRFNSSKCNNSNWFLFCMEQVVFQTEKNWLHEFNLKCLTSNYISSL